jgi:phospholipid/cholesterol/gamma-HCH transport system substrate-binding protein
MARKTSKFMIGVFMTIGVLIGLVAIIWLGASNYFEKGKMYVTYFNESVQGLQVDSAAKYRGVEVGRVTDIRVAPDNQLIEVVMKINLKGHLERDYVSQLKTVGITGIVFVELDWKDPDQPDQSPKIDFGAEYPIIASRPSQIKQILTGIEDVIQSIRQIDTKGISDQIKATTKEIQSFVGSEKIDKTLSEISLAATHLNGVITKVDQALSQGRLENILTEAQTALIKIQNFTGDFQAETKNALIKIQNLTGDVQADLRALELPKTGANLQNATAKIDRILSSGEIEAILAEVKSTLFKAQATVDSVRNEVESLKLRETVAGANRLIEGLDRRTDALALRFGDTAGNMDHLIGGVDQRVDVLTKDFMATTENLRRTLESLQVLLDRLSATPSDLIFSKPPPPRENKR